MFKKGGFTLVELIVVISILAILGTIGFISLTGYNQSARDSVRISDIGNIKKSLILYTLDKIPYPEPSGDITVTFSGSEVWKQGTFGESVFKEVGKLSNVPLDPLTKIEYTYSVLNTGKEFEVGGILEGELSKIGTKANAGETIAKSYTSGNFNSKIAKVEQGETSYVIAVPTLIASDLTNPDYETIVNTNSLAFKGTSKIPANFKGTKFKTNGNGIDKSINPGKEVLFSGNILDLNYKDFISNLQGAYSGTTISENTEIKNILSIDINNNDDVNSFGSKLIKNKLVDIHNSSINNGSNSANEPVIDQYDIFSDNSISLKYDFEDNFDESNGGTQANEIGTSITFVDGVKGGKAFKNTSTRLNINQNFDFSTTGYTASFFIKYPSSGSYHSVFGFNGYPRLYVHSGNFLYYGASGSKPTGITLPNNGEFVHVVFSDDSNGNIELYLNGVKQGSWTGLGALTSETDLYIGGASNGYIAPGEYDTFRLFNRALTESEVFDLYHNDSGIPKPAVSSYAKSCKEILDNGNSTGDGIYTISISGLLEDEFDVYCDMTTDGGGWTLVLKTLANSSFSNLTFGVEDNCLLNTTLGNCTSGYGTYTNIVGTSYMKNIEGMSSPLIVDFNTEYTWYDMRGLGHNTTTFVSSYYANDPSTTFLGYGSTAGAGCYDKTIEEIGYYYWKISDGDTACGGNHSNIVYNSGNYGSYYGTTSPYNKRGILYVR